MVQLPHDGRLPLQVLGDVGVLDLVKHHHLQSHLLVQNDVVYDQQQPNIATIIIINIQQPLPTSKHAALQQKISRQFRRQTHTGYLLSMTSGFVYKKSTVFVCGSIIIFLIIFLCGRMHRGQRCKSHFHICCIHIKDLRGWNT